MLFDVGGQFLLEDFQFGGLFGIHVDDLSFYFRFHLRDSRKHLLRLQVFDNLHHLLGFKVILLRSHLRLYLAHIKNVAGRTHLWHQRFLQVVLYFDQFLTVTHSHFLNQLSLFEL
jgi:hypothetical protein